MGRTKGTYTLTSNIEPKVGAPLDARTIVKLLADLTANNTFEYPYKGMKVFVEENNKSYTLVGSDPTVSTNWIEDNSGGHTIKNPAGTAMTQRSNLQFVDLTVSDDSTNDATKVENIHVIQSESELANLPDGLYMLDDDEGTVIDGNEVGYDNTDSGLVSRNVQDAIDELAQGGYAHHYSTTEQVVGTWIDGKPLYEKTINVQYSDLSTYGSFKGIPLEDTNEKIRNVISACAISASYGNCFLGCTLYGNLNDLSRYFALNMYYNILVIAVSGYSWEQIAPDICATIQYTKTTD